jgi:hypothetical protein
MKISVYDNMLLILPLISVKVYTLITSEYSHLIDLLNFIKMDNKDILIIILKNQKNLTLTLFKC